MAQVKISELPSASSLTGSEVLPVVQGGNTLGATVNQIKDKVQASTINVLKMNASSVQTLANIGELAFNPDTQTLDVKCSADVTLSIGQENYIRGKNAEASTILNGTVVYVSGGLGANSLIKRAGNADGTAERVIGVATQDIGANNIGFITTSGIVNKLNTSAYAEGALLWLGTNGAMTNVKPDTTIDQICIGVVLRSHATDGSILVAVKDDWRDKLAEVRSDLNENVLKLIPITETGKNKYFERYLYDNVYLNSLGGFTTIDIYKFVKFIPVLPSTSYCLTDSNGNPVGSNATYGQFLDINLNVIGMFQEGNKIITTPENAYYINISVSKSSLLIQLEVGSNRTAYEKPDYIYDKLNKNDLVNVFGQSDKKAIAQKVVSDAIGNNYYKFKGTAAAYSNLHFPFSIKAGTVIKNSGDIPIIFASDTSYTNRKDLLPAASVIAPVDYNYVQSADLAGNYEIITSSIVLPESIPSNSIGTSQIIDNSVTKNKLQNQSVTIEKTAFFESINLINKNDPDYKIGYYLDNYNRLLSNPSYDTTGFIKVIPNEKYIFSVKTSTTTVPKFLAYYNSDMVFMSKTYVSNPPKLQTVPSGAYYVRLTVYTNHLSQFEKGEEASIYSEYKLLIPQKIIQQDTQTEPVPYFFLPKDVYVAVGRTIEIYYEQVILNAFKWNIQAICTVGQPLKRKFRIIGDLAHVGNYTLTLRVFNDKGVKSGEQTCTIHIVNDSISSIKKVLPVGDSLTNDKPWLTELTNLNANITRVGTRGIGHEGRSGSAGWYYLNTDGTAKYTFEKDYIGIGSNASVFDSTLPYNIGDFVKYKTISETSYSVFQFKIAHTANTPWNDSEVVNISDTNPFWNFNNNTFSYNHYKTFQGITPDCIILWLGTNGIDSTPETNQNGALGIKRIIDNIRIEDANIPIVVVNTIFRGNQNGIGVQSNADGFSTPTSYKFDEDVKVLLLEQALENMIGDIAQYPNVYLCPVAATHDSEYNFMSLATAKKGVNPRITSTDVVYELFPSEATHPQQAGYLQAADEIYSTLCAVFSN